MAPRLFHQPRDLMSTKQACRSPLPVTARDGQASSLHRLALYIQRHQLRPCSWRRQALWQAPRPRARGRGRNHKLLSVRRHVHARNREGDRDRARVYLRANAFRRSTCLCCSGKRAERRLLHEAVVKDILGRILALGKWTNNKRSVTMWLA